MPITIQHGQQGGTIAGQIIAQAGQASLQRKQANLRLIQQLGTQRDMQLQQIQAQAARQQEAADNAMQMTAMRYGLEEEMKEQEFGRSLAQIQEQAESQAQQWEYRYSTQQRQEIARLNAADNTVESDPKFSDSEKQQWRHISIAKRAGIKPNAFPRDPDKPVYPKGQGVGDFYESNGVLGSRKANGETWQVDWNKTQGGQQKEHELKATQEAAKLEAGIEEERRKFTTALYSKEISDGISPTGQLIKRMRAREEVDAILQHTFGGGMQEEQLGDRDVMYGAKLTEAEKPYPNEVGSAIIFMKAMKSKFGGLSKMPEDVMAAWMESYTVVSDFAKSQGN